MKSLGKKLLSGKFDLLKISLPVTIFEPRSYLQKLGDPLVFPQIMMKAVHAEDPVCRLKWVTTYFVAGYHRAFLSLSKPFNPLLGETWQASLSDGTRVFMEQVSHHPPVSAFQVIGPEKSYYFHGHSQATVTYKANGISSYALGERQLEFLDGTVIDISFPEYNVRGLVGPGPSRGDLSGQVEFSDRTNGLSVVLNFGKIGGQHGILARSDAISGALYRTHVSSETASSGSNSRKHSSKSYQGSMAVRTHSWLGSSFNRHVTHGHLRRSSASSNAFILDPHSNELPTGDNVHIPLAYCSGNWLAYLDWDDQRYWTLAEEIPDAWTSDPNALPSDSCFRRDLRCLAENKLDEAQEAKNTMENLQRSDAKLRAGHSK